ncbi:hypothetical protein KVK17_06590 [Helicobacter pylori]|nr:hypothetical protein KVK17_06590 [Helicobacter pylori]
MSDEITQENELEINSNNQNQEPKEVEKMPLNNIQKAKEVNYPTAKAIGLFLAS